LLKTWVEAGQDYSTFWQLTLREIVLIIGGVSNRREAEMDLLAWQIWNTANCIRADPKHFPKKPSDLIKKKSKSTGKAKSWQQMKHIAQMWSAALGGEEVKKP
jgi:hypothetical protein